MQSDQIANAKRSNSECQADSKRSRREVPSIGEAIFYPIPMLCPPHTSPIPTQIILSIFHLSSAANDRIRLTILHILISPTPNTKHSLHLSSSFFLPQTIGIRFTFPSHPTPITIHIPHLTQHVIIIYNLHLPSVICSKRSASGSSSFTFLSHLTPNTTQHNTTQHPTQHNTT
jgi:hypothetical protein